APIASHGHSRQAHRPELALAERLCRKADRINPTRVCRPFGCLGRGALTPDSEEVFRLLQRVEDSPIARQGRANSSRHPGRGPHHIFARSRRTSSPLWQNLIFGTDSQEQTSAPAHSITSSARASNFAGTSRPSALAVLRLMVNPILVICWTGKSTGFSPLRMRPV